MTPEELDSLQDELEQHLPTSLQSKLSTLFDLVRNAKNDPVRKEWLENQRKILDIHSSDRFYTIRNPNKTYYQNKIL